LQVRIIADESIDAYMIESLRNANYEVLSIRESYRGIKDIEIIVMANERECLILTEDKDFGEWVFSYKSESAGVILLRYEDKDMEEIITAVKKILSEYGENLYGKFTVVTKNKIRIRNIIDKIF
jgi:predicted nuclease of predicted toxin-antitoxin system